MIEKTKLNKKKIWLIISFVTLGAALVGTTVGLIIVAGKEPQTITKTITKIQNNPQQTQELNKENEKLNTKITKEIEKIHKFFQEENDPEKKQNLLTDKSGNGLINDLMHEIKYNKAYTKALKNILTKLVNQIKEPFLIKKIKGLLKETKEKEIHNEWR